MSSRQTFGAMIRALRKERRLTQEDAAAAIGVARSTLASIEAGHDLPGRRTMEAIADFFRVGLDHLRDRTPTPGGPGDSETAKDADEVALLEFWRALTPEQRVLVARMLSIPERKDSAA